VSESQRLTQVVAEILRLPEHSITDELSLATTDSWDSLAHMELVAAIEQEFSVELSADDIVAMVSFAGIRSVLASRGIAAVRSQTG
jgi:acyl carrier protein